MSDFLIPPDTELPFDPPLTPGIDLEPLINLAPGRRSDSAIDGIAVSTVNPDSGRAHVMYVSENLASLLGFRPDQLLGRSPHALFADTTPAAQLDAVAELVEQGQQAVVRLDLAHSSGAAIAVQASFLELPSLAGGWPYFLAVYRDLSAGLSEEQLLADQTAMLDALARGHHINDVLMQVAERVESQVGGGSCWIALADATGLLEPVITSRQPRELIDKVLVNLTHSGHWSTPS